MYHADRQAGGQTDGRTDMTKVIVSFRNLRTRLKTTKYYRNLSRFKKGVLVGWGWGVAWKLTRTEEIGSGKKMIKKLFWRRKKSVYTTENLAACRYFPIEQYFSHVTVTCFFNGPISILLSFIAKEEQNDLCFVFPQHVSIRLATSKLRHTSRTPTT